MCANSGRSSRYISAEVRRRLRESARDRCCVCGRLIPFDEIDLDIENQTLHQHHIVYFSEGGENTEENLLLVCPSCHTRIHTYPEQYPRERLKKAKQHWAQMKQLVPESLYYEPEVDSYPDGEIRQVGFHVATLNLDYQIAVPASVEVGLLARFISMWIMHPLVAFANLAPYNFMFGQAQLTRMGLARKSVPRARLALSMKVGELNLESDDALLALVDFEWVAAMERQVTFEELIARITLTWGEQPQDLDLHLVPASGDPSSWVSYRNRGTLSRSPWAELNVDIRSGFGPEVISVGQQAYGRYLVAVHNYSDESPISFSHATVRVEFGDTVRIFRCPRTGTGRWWHVCVIDYSTEVIDVVDQLRDEPSLSGW